MDMMYLKQCVACDVMLTKKTTEKHHFPLPKAAGGDQTVPLCISCHDMVHRIKVEEWANGWFEKGFHDLPREARLA